MTSEIIIEYLEYIGLSPNQENITLSMIIKQCKKLKREHNEYSMLDKICNYFIINGISDITISNMDKAHEIAPNVFIGPVKIATNLEQLKKYGITHIVSIASEYPATFPQFINKNIGLPDIMEIEQFITIDWLDECFNFINNAILDNNSNKVLIHCQYGKTRSAIVAVYYLAKLKHIKIIEAYDTIQQKRDIYIPPKILHLLEELL